MQENSVKRTTYKASKKNIEKVVGRLTNEEQKEYCTQLTSLELQQKEQETKRVSKRRPNEETERRRKKNDVEGKAKMEQGNQTETS